MAISTFEGLVKDGQIRLRNNVKLPEDTEVYVVIPDATHFNPPAPLAQVTLRNPSTGAIASDVELLVDSGADVTLLPRQAVEGLGISLATGRGYEIAGFDGSKSAQRRSDGAAARALARPGRGQGRADERDDRRSGLG